MPKESTTEYAKGLTAEQRKEADRMLRAMQREKKTPQIPDALQDRMQNEFDTAMAIRRDSE